jgi:hypothetical protein
MWGEGDPGDFLAGRTRRSPMLDGLNVRPIDIVSAQTLGQDVLVMAQPRLLSPDELVALDQWVRGGGRVLIFADPQLEWPSRYPLGDRRRAPPVTLLDPLLAHWGLVLDLASAGDSAHVLDGQNVVMVSAGRWTVPPGCSAPDPAMIDCRIGKGRAILIADADVLDARVMTATGSANQRWFASMIDELSGRSRDSSLAWWPIVASIVLICAGFGAAFLWRRSRKSEHR